MMHLKRLMEKEGKFYIRHYVSVDAIDSPDIYYEELNKGNCRKYFPEIIDYLYEQLKFIDWLKEFGWNGEK